MSPKARWIIGLLLALVIGLAVGLAVVAGDDSDEPETVTVQTETEATEATETQPSPTETAPQDGGVDPPESGEPDGSGGLGFE